MFNVADQPENEVKVPSSNQNPFPHNELDLVTQQIEFFLLLYLHFGNRVMFIHKRPRF